jgi:hypothetical protein
MGRDASLNGNTDGAPRYDTHSVLRALISTRPTLPATIVGFRYRHPAHPHAATGLTPLIGDSGR